MPQWLDTVLRVALGAAAVALMLKLRGRRWLTKWRTHLVLS